MQPGLQPAWRPLFAIARKANTREEDTIFDLAPKRFVTPGSVPPLGVLGVFAVNPLFDARVPPVLRIAALFLAGQPDQIPNRPNCLWRG